MRRNREVNVFLHMTWNHRNGYQAENRMLDLRVEDTITGAELQDVDRDVLLQTIAEHNEWLALHAYAQRPMPGTPSLKRVGFVEVYAAVDGYPEKWTCTIYVLASTSQHAALDIYDTFRPLWTETKRATDYAGMIVTPDCCYAITPQGSIYPFTGGIEQQLPQMFFDVARHTALGVTHIADYIDDANAACFPVYCMNRDITWFDEQKDIWEANEAYDPREDGDDADWGYEQAYYDSI